MYESHPVFSSRHSASSFLEQHSTGVHLQLQWCHWNRLTLAELAARLKVGLCWSWSWRNRGRGSLRFGEHSITTTTETTGAQRTTQLAN